MLKRLKCVLALSFGSVFATSCHNAAAQNTGDQQKQLEAITATADRICNVVTTEGSTESAKVSGEVKAELSGLAKRLANLGVSGTGAIDSSEYHGLLQQDLALALKDNASCKTHVFDKLIDKLVPSQDHKSSENANPEMQVRINSYTGILLTNEGGQAFNVDVTGDAKIYVSCFDWGRKYYQNLLFPVSFSDNTSDMRSFTAKGEDLIRSWPFQNIPKALLDLSKELDKRNYIDPDPDFDFGLGPKTDVQFGMRVLMEYESSDQNAYRRYFGVHCYKPKPPLELELFKQAYVHRCESVEFGPKAYNAFYKERGMVGSEGEATSFTSLPLAPKKPDATAGPCGLRNALR
jgi:hypothetical protein